MLHTLWSLRCRLVGLGTSLSSRAKQGWERSRTVRAAYIIAAWAAFAVLALSLIMYRESRTMLVQYMWSTYVLLQLWLLCRSKTLTWRQASMFAIFGACVAAPLSNWTVQLAHAIFGGQPSSTWSVAGITPLFEELWKLLPLAGYLLFSRRATSLSLTDYALIGGASGVGFQFIEELTRRWVQGGSYAQTWLGEQMIHWQWLSLFPGKFEGSYSATLMSVTHPVHTALVALGIGIATRLRRRFTAAVLAIPVILYLWAVLNHAAYNGKTRLYDWLRAIHDWTGSGYTELAVFLLLLAAATVMDYLALHRIRAQLPAKPGEAFIQPLSEAWHTLWALLFARRRLAPLLLFYRERRELGFTLLYGNTEARQQGEELTSRTRRFAAMLASCLLLAAAGGLLMVGSWVGASNDTTCFACLFDSLQSWWDRLSGFQQVAIVLGMLALALLFVGFWPALGIALTLSSIAGGGHAIADYIRNPRKLLTPQNALAVAVAIALSRVPVGRLTGWIANKLGPPIRGAIGRLLDKIRPRKNGGGGHKPGTAPPPPKPDGPDGPGSKPDGPAPQTRYSGGLFKVNKPDPQADKLAERLGGQSRVRFRDDPANREFDAVSDEFIAQTKPAMQQLGKNARSQMRASFEAAQETGRKVYYHFDGQPAASVIDKLHEYSRRYGVEVVIDTTPFP